MVREPEHYKLQDLIQVRRGKRSYARLSQDCGGFPGASRIQQIVTGPLNDFPSADTIQGLALGLGVSVTDVTLAAARSLGLRVATSDPSALVLNGAGLLPEHAQQAIRETARSMQRLHRQGARELAALAAYNDNERDSTPDD